MAEHRANSAPSRRPLYGQVREILVDNIRNGEWMVGDSLPNESTLAERFGVSIGTVRRAIEGLEHNGLVKKIQGRGTYVAGIGSHVLTQKFTRIMDAAGHQLLPDYELLSVSEIPASPEACHALELEAGARLFEIRQWLLVGGTSVGLETSQVSVALLPMFGSQMRYGQHLYPVLADYGIIVTGVTELISTETAANDPLHQMLAPAGAKLLRVLRTARAMDGKPVEYRDSVYAGSKINYAASIF